MTRYIAAYDTESLACLEACRAIVAMHRKHQMPATFFIVGKTLEDNPREYRELLDDPLFEIASHTYSHKMLRDHPFCGPAASDAEIREEIMRGKETVERIFERPCLGLRPGCGFDQALRGAPVPLRVFHEAGLRYVSSLAWGPQYSMPALLTEPFTYADDGYPDLWELPLHGWHENLLKPNRMLPIRGLLWPPAMPEAIPPGLVQTPAEEFAVNRIFLDRALERRLPFVSLIWHPWSLHKFDPAMQMLDLTFSYVRRIGLQPSTYAQLHTAMASRSRMNHDQTVIDWKQFRQHWGGLHNFLMAGKLTAGFDYAIPPLERIIDEVRRSPESIVRSGVKGDVFDLTDIKEEFVRQPLAEALQRRFVLAHFRLHPYLSGPKQVFEGIEERWVEPWRQQLGAHGFTFKSVFAILFASGPNSASNYHLDITHQLAWQRYGAKHFSGLNDPDRWTTREQRGRCELKGTVRPSGITATDTYSIAQPPGSVLWNAHTTPHWVETFDQCAVTLTLVHEELRLDGRLCPHAEECAQWREENNWNKPGAKRY